MKNINNQYLSKLSGVLDSIGNGEIQPKELFNKIDCDDVLRSIYPTIIGASRRQYDGNLLLAKGVNASPGAAKGILALDSNTAESWARKKKDVVLLLPFYSPDDVGGMIASLGVVATEGGATSHAAVVCRQFGIPAIVGCSAIKIDIENRRVILDNIYVCEGEEVAMDGSTGTVYFSSTKKLPEDFYIVSEENLELLESLVKMGSEIIDKRLIDSSGLELAVLITLIEISNKRRIEDLEKIKPNLDYFIEVNSKVSDESLLLNLLLATINSLFSNIILLLSGMGNENDISIRKKITLDLRRLNNVAKKSTENRMLFIYLEKAAKHIDNLVSEYQKPVDVSEIKYSRPNLLLIDDEPYFIQEIIQSLQENLNAVVTITINVDEAVDVLKSASSIDLVIADVMIPMKDRLSTEPYQGGLIVCQKVREIRGPGLPIICLTVMSDVIILSKLKETGVNLIINKPALPSEVVEAVHQQLTQQIHLPDSKLTSKEITRRQLELRSKDSEMKIRALWALLQLARYDGSASRIIKEFMNSETDVSVKRITKSILDRLDLQEKVPEEKFVTSKKQHTSATISQAVDDKLKFDIFLSHNSVDKKWVVKLKSALEKLNIKVWLDKDEIRPGDLFVKALEDGLEESKCVGIIISPEAAESGWVKEEYYRALNIANSSSRTLRLIPILLRDATLPGFLTSRNWVDFRDEAYFDDNVKKLVWGITGQKPD